MGLNQESTVRLDQSIITLKDIREFVDVTAGWGEATLVKVEHNKLEAEFGDILR